jgi:hypothetical protein
VNHPLTRQPTLLLIEDEPITAESGGQHARPLADAAPVQDRIDEAGEGSFPASGI